jgi:hypothetical protein
MASSCCASDEVEVNITEGQEKVKKGVESLEKASEYQKKSRGKVWLLIVAPAALCVGTDYSTCTSVFAAHRAVGAGAGHRDHSWCRSVSEAEVKPTQTLTQTLTQTQTQTQTQTVMVVASSQFGPVPPLNASVLVWHALALLPCFVHADTASGVASSNY